LTTTGMFGREGTGVSGRMGVPKNGELAMVGYLE